MIFRFERPLVVTLALICLVPDIVTAFQLQSGPASSISGGKFTLQAPQLAVSKSIDEDEVLAEFDEDDGYEIDLSKKDEWMSELRALARSSSRDPSAVDKAQAIFDQMFEAYVLSEETTMWPTVDVYNLLLETHSYSKSPNGADEAEKLLGRMEDDSVDFIARPNLETYLNVMDAWAMRKDASKAESVIDRLERRYKDTGDEALLPTAAVYNKLIKAYGILGEVDQAEKVFRSLVEKEMDDPLKANQKSWVQRMKLYASSQDGVHKVQEIFREMQKAYRMGEEDYMPKADAYTTLIRALGQTKDGAEEAEATLFEMINQFRAGDEDMQPTAETFRNVLIALQRRKTVSAAKVEQLIQIQEGLYAATKDEALKPDGKLYNIALFSIARSRDSKKAVRARRMVEKMLNSGNESDAPTIRTYFNLLSACAYTDGTAEEKLQAFQIAIDGLKELRETESYEPDSSCFGMFLKACANLMPESRKRDAVVESVFQKCCNDGLADDFVLSEFGRASSEALQLEILGGFLADDVRIPPEWSKNIHDAEDAN